MAKIQITESELHNLVLNTVRRIIKESRDQFGTSYGNKSWEPFYDEYINENVSYEELENLVKQGIIPAELNDCFDINASADCSIYADTNDVPGSIDTKNHKYEGDYEKATALIAQIKDEKIRQLFYDSLEMFCEGIEMDEFDEYEPDWDSMPGGHDYYE